MCLLFVVFVFVFAGVYTTSFSFHFDFVNYMNGEYQHDRTDPEADVLYMCWDHKDRF